jgi:DNA-binding winged helix-turn-helix (wHTH) protein
MAQQKMCSEQANRLRDVLGDSADNPTFIETLPRLGYRFIAPIEGPATQEVTVLQGTHKKSATSGANNAWGLTSGRTTENICTCVQAMTVPGKWSV